MARADIMAKFIHVSILRKETVSNSYKKGLPNASNVSDANDSAISANVENTL